MPTLAQTLHGYDQGHRLLASGGDLDERELALLDRLSDLSGYLPTGTHFDRYHTGFPCGRYYALACTWMDLTATRAGTVLTHTLLLPRHEARALDDLWGLTVLHRLPKGAGDRELYREPLSVHELPSVPQEALPPEEATAAVVLLLGTTDRPILWVDERQPEPIVRFLWSVLRAEQRERFAFCTFALQPRTVEGRAFDFLGLPPTARGSFLERAGSEAWWDSGRLLHPRLAGLTQQAWATELARNGAAMMRRLEASCQENGLHLPAPKDIATLWRFMELEPAATERLAAARARADLFERLWPGLEPTHPAAESILRALLERQGDAALEPRPLWELTDFLKRPMVRSRLGADAGFASQVELVLVRELERRLDLVPERTAQELQELLGASGTRWSGALLAVIRRALALVPDAAVRLAPLLMLKATETHWPELLEEALTSLPPPERQRALEEAIRRTTTTAVHEELLRLAEETADLIDDLALMLFIGKLRGRVLEALQAISQRLLARDPTHMEEKLAPVLSEVEATMRLSWALEMREPPRLAWFTAEQGAEAAREQGLGPGELVRRCGGTPNGARVLLLFAGKMHRLEPLAQELRQTPELALDLVVLALHEEGPRLETLTSVASELIPAELLLAPELYQAMLATRDRWRVRGLVGRLGPQWIRAICAQSLPPAELARWLDIPLLRQWLRDASRSQLLSVTGVTDGHHLLLGVVTIVHAWLDSSDVYDRAWIRPLLGRLLENPTERELDLAAEPLASLLRRLSTTLLDDDLAAELLVLVNRTRPASGWHLVEVVFPRVYARAYREEKSLLKTLASLIVGANWDKAKPLRQWLVDIYVGFHWPPASFLRCLEGDIALFFRLAHRAARSRAGMDFLHRLPSALQAAPELARHWYRPIQEVLANPHRPVDFE